MSEELRFEWIDRYRIAATKGGDASDFLAAALKSYVGRNNMVSLREFSVLDQKNRRLFFEMLEARMSGTWSDKLVDDLIETINSNLSKK